MASFLNYPKIVLGLIAKYYFNNWAWDIQYSKIWN